LIKKAAHIALSVWMSILLLFGTTPKEFIHLFADHTDTVEQYHTGKQLAIEKQHHHCQFLGFSFAPFVKDHQSAFLRFSTFSYFIKHEALSVHFVQRAIVSLSLRGPPAC
jgi:hypothetical protein